MGLILPLLFIVGAGGSLSILAKRRIEETIPVALMGSALVIYLAGLLGPLSVGFWLAAAWAALCPVLLGLSFIRNRQRFREELSRLLTPGFFLFLLLYVYVFLLDFRRGLTWWDEYSHWGPMAKETLRIDSFYCNPDSALIVHRDYPPIVTLFQYLWMKLCGGYDPTYLYRSLHMLSFSLFLPALKGLEWPKGAKPMQWLWRIFGGVLAVGAVVISCNIIPYEVNFFNALHTDGIVGLLLGFCLAVILLEPKPSPYQAASLTVALSFIALTKQIGVYFVALCICLFAAETLLSRRKERLTEGRQPMPLKRIWLSILTMTAVSAGFFLSWLVVQRVSGEGTSAFSTFNFAKLPGILMGRAGAAYQKQTVTAFQSAFFSRRLGTQPIDLSYAQALWLFAGLFALLALRGGKHRELLPEPNRTGVFAAFAVLGGAVYGFLIMVSYIFHFSSYEAPRLMSYERYVGTYLIALTAVGVMGLLHGYCRGAKKNAKRAAAWMLVAACGLLLCVPADRVGSFLPSTVAYDQTGSYRSDCQLLAEQTEENAAVLVVAQGDNGLAGHVMCYELMPRKVEAYSLGQPKYEGDVWSVALSAQELSEMLEGYDYLYLYELDEEFSQLYGELFSQPEKLENGQLYSIGHTENGLVLEQR